MRNYRFLESWLYWPVYMNKKKLANCLIGKSVLITGASSGIGEQLAYELSEIECELILVARRKERLQHIKNKVESKRANVSVFQADLRKKDEIGALIAFLYERSNGLDIVISNAGLSIKRSIYESLDRYHDFSRTMAINYFAPVQLLLATIPLLERGNGRIINVSTVNTQLAPMSYFSAYQASKSAFDVWLRSISSELKVKGISVNSIYLPLVRTDMIKPTIEYEKMPAMSASDAAKLICKSLYSKKKKYQPWWLIFVQLASVFLRYLPYDFERRKS